MSTTRRTFLGAVASAPLVIPASSPGFGSRHPASDRITVGIIGCGKMANDYHIPRLLAQPDTQLVAVCEVDRTRREHAAGIINRHYGGEAGGGFQGVDQYEDYRELVARDDIDAVCIVTPDHWHAIPLIEACQAGKDVYCEKPLTLTIREAERCIQAARRHARVVQTGSQQRSNVFGKFRQAVEIVRSGRLGPIRRVTVGVGDPPLPCDLGGEAIESGLNWDLWLGCAPLREYHSILSPRGVHGHFPQWRKYHEYSGGGHSDMGAHHYDIAQWALDMDESGPVEIIPPGDPDARRGVRYRYANGIELEHGGPGGCVFHGDNGTLRIDRGVLESDPLSIVETPLGQDDVRLPVSPGHHRDWLDCIRSRQRPVADVEKGARTATLVHLGNLAYRHRRPFRWNPENWQFEDAADDRYLDRERRDPWYLPESG